MFRYLKHFSCFSEVCVSLGDSGGPILLPDSLYDDISKGEAAYDVLVGIISFGKDPCGEIGFPGVYTSIAFYYQWIEEVIRANT